MRSRILFLILACICLSAFAQTDEAGEWREHGYNAWMAGEYAMALDSYKKILERNPEDYDARLAIARLLTATEDYEGAIAVYQAIYAEDATDVEALNGLGTCYGRLGIDSLSVLYFERALDRLPGEVGQYLLLAQAYGNAGREKDAIAAYQKVMEIDDTYSEAWAGTGKMYYWLDRPATARKYYLRALELDPENGDILQGYRDVKQELKWGLTLRTSPVVEKEENYTINAIVTRLLVEKRVADRITLKAGFLLDHSSRDFTGEEGDTARWFNANWLQADYMLPHHTLSAYAGYSFTDDKVSSYGLTWKLKYNPGNFIIKNTLQAGYDYYYYWNRVGARSVTEEAAVSYAFAELSGRYSYGIVDPVNTIDYMESDVPEVRENPYQSYAFSLSFRILKNPDIRLGLSHSYLDYRYKSPLYYSPSGRNLTGATASVYYGIRSFYCYGNFSYNIGHEHNYEDDGSGGYGQVELDVDNWSAAAEIGYEHDPFSVSVGASNFYNPYYENITGFVALRVSF